jgi:hypothetical protein
MSDQDRASGAGAAGGWLHETIRKFSFLSTMREVQHVKRTCRECLLLYRQIERGKTGSTVDERYAFVVAERTGADLNGVKSVMRHVEESFAVWPNERPVHFRDVVQYLAITECLREAESESGIRAEVAAVVARLIPANL